MKSVRDIAGLNVEPMALRSAREQASAMLEEAAREAAAIVNNARREATRIAESAALEGARSGRESVVASYSAAVVRAEQSLAITEREIVTLALDVARTVLGHEAQSSPTVLESVARRALARVRRARSLVLRVHRDDVELARQHVREWLAPGSEPSVIEVIDDPAVDRGGVLVECDLGRIDARIASQLAAIERALEGS